jgi:hypothetical protein
MYPGEEHCPWAKYFLSARFTLPGEREAKCSSLSSLGTDRKAREQRLSYLRYRTQISRENLPEDDDEGERTPNNLSPGSSPPRSAFSPLALLSLRDKEGGTSSSGASPSSYPRYIPRPSVLSLGKPLAYLSQCSQV